MYMKCLAQCLTHTKTLKILLLVLLTYLSQYSQRTVCLRVYLLSVILVSKWKCGPNISSSTMITLSKFVCGCDQTVLEKINIFCLTDAAQDSQDEYDYSVNQTVEQADSFQILNRLHPLKVHRLLLYKQTTRQSNQSLYSGQCL